MLEGWAGGHLHLDSVLAPSRTCYSPLKHLLFEAILGWLLTNKTLVDVWSSSFMKENGNPLLTYLDSSPLRSITSFQIALYEFCHPFVLCTRSWHKSDQQKGALEDNHLNALLNVSSISQILAGQRHFVLTRQYFCNLLVQSRFLLKVNILA